MTAVLVLGGTGWLSGRVARGWVEQGADVTCLARGGRSAPDGARLVTADRDLPGAYDAVADRDWDEVVDISSDAAHAASAVAALADRAAHWTYISTISVYADSDAPERAMRPRHSSSPPSPATSTTTAARKSPPRHPFAPHSGIAQPSCGRA